MSDRVFPVIETERLILNQLTVDDREPLFAVFSDPNVIKHYDVEQFKHIEEADRLIEYFNARFDTDTGVRWAIRSKDNHEFIGTCGFLNWNEFDHSAVVGYELANQHWGQGFAFEAVKHIIDFIFSPDFHFYVYRIEALILPSNTPSEVLINKLGFRFEGALRGKCYWNGDFHDMNMFGLLRGDREKDKEII